MRRDHLEALAAARRDRRAVALVTDVETGEGRLVREDDVAREAEKDVLGAMFRAGRSGFLDGEAKRLFATVHVPPPRLIAIGAVHISQALIPIAAVTGFDLVIIDPRTAFATEERFAGVALHADWPETVLPTIGIDRHTALAALSHDPKIDDPGIEAALAAESFYVGALGSRRTHAKRRERLAAKGVAETALDGIHAPIGLDIGAESPAEIAVAVMAEVIAAYRQRGFERAA